MQTCKIPLSICDKIDKICRAFIWSGPTDQKKLHLLSWDIICTPKGEGGLGFRKARNFNNSFLMKLAWNLINNKEALWVQVMRNKYGCPYDVILELRQLKIASNAWRGICHVWPTFKRNLIWRLGNGLSVSFWHDHWIPGVHNLSAFALIDIDDDNLNVKVADFVRENGSWDLDKLLQVLPPDCVDLLAPMKALENCLGEDSVAWSLSSTGEFSVKSAHSIFHLPNDFSNRNLF